MFPVCIFVPMAWSSSKVSVPDYFSGLRSSAITHGKLELEFLHPLLNRTGPNSVYPSQKLRPGDLNSRPSLLVQNLVSGRNNGSVQIKQGQITPTKGIGYIRITPNVEPNLPLKPTKVCFVCIGPISVSKVYGLLLPFRKI